MEKITYISFPGLGIDEFAVKNAAFSIFGRSVMWYGIIIVIGIIAAYFYVTFRGNKNEGLTDDDITDFCMVGVIAGIVGARIWYVATSFSSFKAPTFWETVYNCVAIWEGGLGFYGGLILGMLSLLLVCRIKKKNFLKVADCFSLGVMIAQIFGRWGNFMNGEAHGCETSLPWRMGLRAEYEEVAAYYHPTFFYESLWNLIGFIIINFTYKHKKYNGQIVLRYLAWYGFGRMFIEGLRTDSLYIGQLRISQLFGFICFFVASGLLIAFDIVHVVNKNRFDAESVSINIETAPAEATVTEKAIQYTASELSETEKAPSEEPANEKEITVDIASLHAEDE